MIKNKAGVRWLVHSHQNPPRYRTLKQVKQLLKKYTGNYSWLDDICHVYLPPIITVNVGGMSGQKELRYK